MTSQDAMPHLARIVRHDQPDAKKAELIAANAKAFLIQRAENKMIKADIAVTESTSCAEYRIMMPLSVDEYQIGQLYATAVASTFETGGGEGVEVLRNEAFDGVSLMNGKYSSGQYTKKAYHFASKIPRWMRNLAPKKSLAAVEESWNAYPYCKTIIYSRNDDYVITIETMHLADRGTAENALNLSPDLLTSRRVEIIDIAGNALNDKDYKKDTDPNRFKSTTTHRGPLTGEWWKSAEPVMCCYKVVKIEIVGSTMLQRRLKNFLIKEYARTFQRFNRQVFCWIDTWHFMNVVEIRELEEEVRADLKMQLLAKSVRGATAAEE